MSKFIKTVSGEKIHFLEPWKSTFKIQDIAWALSLNCRFNGQVKGFYSVAEHCYNCVRVAQYYNEPLEVQKMTFLHDAGEAFISDIPKPIKDHIDLHSSPGPSMIEQGIMNQICKTFGLDEYDEDRIKYYDFTMLKTEGEVLTTGTDDWSIDLPPQADSTMIHCWAPQKAFYYYIDMFNTLWRGTGHEV